MGWIDTCLVSFQFFFFDRFCGRVFLFEYKRAARKEVYVDFLKAFVVKYFLRYDSSPRGELY